MKKSEAREIITMLKGGIGLQFPLADETVEWWLNALVALDAEQSTKAVVDGMRVWKRFPSWAEFREVYNAQRRLGEPYGEQRAQIPEGKRGEAAPEWVHVWFWCRHVRTPRNFEPFPQQRGHVDDALIISMERYEELRQEWADAGSPRGDVSEVLVG